ncbi:hypothetical protein FRC01_006857 [Tulasnella sp. 417]|nr:hypothetical protein FRC01_006857 [Tulasnella sp. 417]
MGERPIPREGLLATNQDPQEQIVYLYTSPNYRSSPTYVKTPGFPINTEVQMSPEHWQPALPDSPNLTPLEMWDPANDHPRTPGLSPTPDQKSFGEAIVSPASKELGRLAWGNHSFPATPTLTMDPIQSSPAIDVWETRLAGTNDSGGRTRSWPTPSSRLSGHGDIAEWVEWQLELAVEAQEAHR